MSIFTRDKIFISADKTSYLEYDKGGASGAGDMALFLNNTEVVTYTTTGVTFNQPIIAAGGAFTASSAIATETLAVSGDAAVTGVMTLGTGLTLTAVQATAGTTLGYDVFTVLTSTGEGPTYTMPPPLAGAFKIIVAPNADSTSKLAFVTGDLIGGFSTQSYIGLVGGTKTASVGLVAVTTDAWHVLFPSLSTTSVVVSTVSS